MDALKHLPLEHIHKTLGAKMVPFAGYNMPVRYSSDIEEHMAVRQAAGLFDVSHMGELYIQGKNASAFIDLVTTNRVSKLFPGRVQYSLFTNNHGGIIDDLLIYMLDANRYMLVVNASNIEKDVAWLECNLLPEVEMLNVSAEMCLFALQGPKSTSILKKLTGLPLEQILYYHFAKGTVAGIDGVMVSATGYTGAGGFELYVPNAYAEKLWNAMMEAGTPEGLKPCGLGARDTLRLEKCYTLYGNDMNESITPLQVNLHWAVDFSKNFIGKEALLQQKNNGIPSKWVALEMLKKAIPRKGYKVFDQDGNMIGEITSGTQSPVLQKGIGMAHLQTAYATVGNTVFVEIRGQKIPAEIIKPPFVK